jgi:alpha-tubulin suppressor-like RCC1 family protein
LASGAYILSIGEARNSLFAVDSSGNIWANGSNAHIMVPTMSGYAPLSATDGPIELYSAPEPPPAVVPVAIVGGQGHLLILMSDASVWAMGNNDHGQCGQPMGDTPIDAPTAVSGLSNVTSITAGNQFSGYVVEGGDVYLWGYNLYGQCGNGSMSDLYTPTQPMVLGGGTFPPSGSTVMALSCGGDEDSNGHTLALVVDSDDNYTIWATGDNTYGQLGPAARLIARFIPA